MKITCALNSLQITKLFKLTVSAMKDAMNAETFFDSDAFMQDLFDKISKKQDPANAAKFIQQVPSLIYLASGKDELLKLDFDPKKVRNQISEFKNPDTGLVDVLNKFNKTTTPQDLITLNNIINSYGLQVEETDEKDEDPIIKEIKLKPFSVFTTTFQEFIPINPETKELLTKEKVDTERKYIYNALNNIRKSVLNDPTLSNDIIYQGKKLTLVASKILDVDINDLDVTTTNDIKKSLKISKGNKTVEYKGEDVTQTKDRVILILSDSEGNLLYFDKDGNITTKEQGGKLVFQYLRTVRNSKTVKNELVVTNIYGVTSQILDPVNVAEAEAKMMGLTKEEYNKQLILNGSSFSKRVIEIKNEQQEDFKRLKSLTDKVLSGEQTMVPLTGFSVGVSSDFPLKTVKLKDLTTLDGVGRNDFKTIKIVKDSRDGFYKGNSTILLNNNEFKVDRPDMSEDIANKIAAALTNPNISDAQKLLYIEYFMSNNISNSVIKYKYYFNNTNKKLTFYLRPYTLQEAKGRENTLAEIDLVPANKQAIFDGLMNAYGLPGSYKASKMTYNEKALKTEKFFDYNTDTDTLNTTPSDYIALVQNFNADVDLNAVDDPGFYNSYIQFGLDTQDFKVKTFIENEADTRSEIRKKKDNIAEVLKDGDIEAIVTNVDSGVKEGKQYAFFNVKVDNTSYRIKLDNLRETADFTFPSIGSIVTLTVNDVVTNNGTFKDVVSVYNSDDNKLGVMYETDFENNEEPRKPIPNIVKEEIQDVVTAKEDISIEPGKGTVSNLFTLDRSTSLPNGITDQQIKDATLWWENSPLSKIIGLLPVADIVNSNAYARFIASADILNSGGKIGNIEINEDTGGNMVDAYHEAWHAFSQLFLTKAEKIALYNEVRNSDPKYKNFSNFAIEEKIAEDFRDYALNPKAKKGAPKRNTIFRKIWNFLKALFNKKVSTNSVNDIPMVDELFNKLYFANSENKLLNNYTPLIDNVMFDILNRGIEDVNNKKEDVLNFQDSQLISNSIDSIISEIIDEQEKFSNLKSGVLTILSDKISPNGLTNKQVLYGQVKIRLEDLLAKLNLEISEFTEPINDIEIYEQDLVKDNQRVVNAALLNWGDYKSGTVKYHINNSTFDIVRQKYSLIEDESDDAGSLENIDNTERAGFDNKVGEQSLETLASKETLYVLKSLFKIDKGETVKNRLGFKELADFSSVWNNITRAIGGVNDRVEAYEKLGQASLTFPELKQLINSKLPNPKTIKNLYEKRISAGFWQDFRKPRISYIQLTAFNSSTNPKVKDFNVEVTEASIETSNVINRFRNKFNAALPNKFISKTENNNSVLNLQAIVDAGFNSSKSFEFVRSLGIELDDLAIIKKALESDPTYYGLSYLYDYVKKVNAIQNDVNATSEAKKLVRNFKADPIKTFMSKVKPGILGDKEVTQKSLILKLAELQGRYGVDSSNFSVLNAEKNLVYEHIDHHTISMITNAINNVKSVTDLWTSDKYNYTKYFDPNINSFTLRSKILNSIFNIGTKSYDRIGDNTLDLQMVSGTQIADTDNGSNTTSLDVSSKFLQEMHMMLKSGLQEFMRHASKSSSYGARVNGEITGGIEKGDDSYLYVDIDKFAESGVAENYANNEIFLDYISAELDRIFRFKNNVDEFKNYAGYNRKIKDKDGKTIGYAGEMFTAFDNALSEDTKNKLYALKDKVNISDINFLKTYLSTDPILKDDIFKDLNKYFDSQTTKNLKYLQENNFIDKALKNRLKVFNLSANEIERVLVKAFTYNSWIHNFETANIFYGDIVQYNHAKEEMHKRNTGSTSGGLGFLTDVYAQKFVNDVLNPTSYASTLDSKYQKFTYNGTFDTAIMQDIVRPSLYLGQIEKGLREDYIKRYKGKNIPSSEVDRRIELELKPYKKIEEADGQGYITIDAYRTLKVLQNSWSDQQEIMFKKIINGVDISTSDVIELFPVYKVQNFGHLANTGLPVNAMHKFALAPLIPSVIKGSDLQSLHEQMMESGIQYATFQTGSKVGSVTSEINEKGDAVADVIYNDGNQKELKKDIKFTPNTIYLEYLKDVTKVPNVYKGKTIFSTQLRKLITEGMYENGKVVNSDNKPFVDAYENTVKEYSAILKTELLNEIGFEYKNGKYTGNLDKLLKVVQNELTRREMPEHLVRYIGVTKNGDIKNDLSFHLEADDIEKILVSLVQKRLIKQKVKGEALVQISSAMTNGLWTNGLKNATKADVLKYLGSNTLPFYNRVDNVTSAMKVAIALQGDFKNLLNLTDNDGVTIGTIERLNELVKDDTWVEKNRANITMTAVRIPVQGLNSMEFMEVYHFLDPAAGNIIIPPTEIVAKSGTDFDVDKLTVFMPNLNAQGNAITSDKTNDEINTLIKSGKLKDKEVKKLIKVQKASLENKLITTVRNILELPDNYAGLVRPNDTYLLKEIADRLQNKVIDYDRFQNEFEEGYRNDNNKTVISPTRVLEVGYNLHKHDVNMVGKKGLGIVALKNALHPVYTSLGAKMPLKYKEQIKTGVGTNVAEGTIEYDMRLLLNHNKTPEGNISLSGLYSADGLDKISDLYSQMMNGLVDVEKDAWIFFIQGNIETIPILTYLLKAGVPKEEAILFVSQPLMRDYAKQKKLLNSTYGSITGISPESTFFVNYQAAQTVLKNRILNDVSLRASILKTIDQLKDSEGSKVILKLKDKDPKEVSKKKLIDILDEKNILDIVSIEDLDGKSLFKSAYTAANNVNSIIDHPVSNANFYYTALAATEKSSPDAFNISTLSSNLDKNDKSSPEALAAFLHFLEIEKQIKGIETVQRQSNPDTKVDKTIQEILQKAVNLEDAAEMSKVDPGLVEALKKDSILASFFDNDLTVDILEPLFKLRNNSDVANFIEMVISKRQGTIRKVFPGKDAIKDFINAYKNGVVNYAYQNYLTNFIDSDGNVTDMPDVYRNLPITKTKGLVNGVEVTNEGIKVDMARLEKDYNLKLYENTSLAADRYNSPERNLRGFTPESNLFPTKSGFFRFNVEREFLRNKFPKESLLKNKDYLHYKTIISRSIKDDTKASNAAYEAYLNQRALLNTFNRNAIMNNTDYSYSQKVMDIINEFPHLKVRYPVLNQLAIPNVKSGEKVLTLNNKLSVKGELAESYHQNLLDLANPNIIKVKSTKEGDTEDNKRVSELFKALPQIMIYQHGIGNSKYGFNNVLPYEIYLSIMRNASGLFINKNLNTRTFEDIYDKLMKTNNDKKIFFKDYISPVREVAKTYDYSSEEDINLVQPVISDNGTTMSFGTKTITPNRLQGNMTYSYGNNKRNDIISDTTFDAIVNGERTATTRYGDNDKINYWKNAKVGDIITWKSADGRTVDVIVTKALTPLKGSGKTVEDWSKLEGWSVDYFNKNVRPKLDQAWQIEFKLVNDENNVETIQPSTKILEVIPAYGAVQVSTNPTKEFDTYLTDVISDNIKNNAYVENGSSSANLMFSYGWQWKGNNSKQVIGDKLIVQPAKVDFSGTGNPITVKSKYFYDSKYNDGVPVPNISELDFLKKHIENNLGIDMSNYDVALNNIYTEGTNLYRHTDIDESNTAKNYPVVVYVLGNEHKVRIDDNGGAAVRGMGEMVNPKTLTLKNGDIYTFGINGKGRFEAVHDVVRTNKTDDSFPPITLPDGRTIKKYTVTFTFRRAADLEPGMPITPAKLSMQPSTTESTIVSLTPSITISDFYNELTEEQKKKIGTLEDLNDQYNEIPFQMTEEEFINNIKCNL
jgi:hypothetical protein